MTLTAEYVGKRHRIGGDVHAHQTKDEHNPAAEALCGRYPDHPRSVLTVGRWHNLGPEYFLCGMCRWVIRSG